MLNARRHRDGDQANSEPRLLPSSMCSTPGGIETVIRLLHGHDLNHPRVCSTPGGIETVIRGLLSPRAGHPRRVLNARRHRDGDQASDPWLLHPHEGCSTPGGIETVISEKTMWGHILEQPCSTPGGIETVIRPADLRLPVVLGVLNARRHRDGDQAASGSCGRRPTACAQRPEASRR